MIDPRLLHCWTNFLFVYRNTTYTDITIKDIRPGLKNINVVFIVLEVGAATVTKENREVRTFKVADPTACINVSVWDEPGKLLVPGDIVRLTKGYASIWRQCLTLYSGKSGDIHKIGDFCMIFNEQTNMSEPNPNFAANHLGTNIMLNNGTPSNNGVSNQIRPILAPSMTLQQPNANDVTASKTLPASPRLPPSNETSNKGNLASASPSSAPKTNARSGRNAQTRTNVKNDRR